MLVTMRGEWGEFNPWQIPMGQGTAKALEDAGVIVYHVEDADELPETVYAASQIAFNSYRPVGIERDLRCRVNRLRQFISIFNVIDDHARILECLGSTLTHRDLPRIELAPLAAHGDQHQQRRSRFLDN